jgi:tRNA nucleotidyltransferase (CCA-adding enzyme)
MVASGEVDALVAERVWQELSRGLMSEQPSRMLRLLSAVGAAQRMLPELVLSAHVQAIVDRVARQRLPLASRYAVLCLETSERKALATRLRVPSECADMALLLPLVLAALVPLSEKLSTGKVDAIDGSITTTRVHAASQDADGGLTALSNVRLALSTAEPADLVLSLFETCDALRKPERFDALLQTVGCVDEAVSARCAAWQYWLQVVLAVDAGAAARAATAPEQIKHRVRAARLAALQGA